MLVEAASLREVAFIQNLEGLCCTDVQKVALQLFTRDVAISYSKPSVCVCVCV